MLSPLPRSGYPRCISALLLALFLSLSSVFVSPAVAAPFAARSLGDFSQVAVVEVAGNFDALDAFGQPNGEARRALAREFYRSHGDDYDFLVIFTNFDVRMPSLQAKAFFAPARNDVQGIGLPLYDHTALYSSDGSPLRRLEGTIDMGNLAAHVMEPADPRFETTLRVLTHEMLHRWGAYVRFLDAGVPSDALLGLDQAHWSFLLDSNDSTLYGNRWQDNGDGTFTALTPDSAHPGERFGRLLNPLELYLMGFAGPEQIPPMQLLDSPGIDPAQLPAPGVTIPGMLRTLTIDQIIAAEGPRTPAATESRKELRMGFVLAVAPGSFAADDPAVVAQLAAIRRLSGEWEKRFAILTDGQGRMQTGLVVEPVADTNPPLPGGSESLLTAAQIETGVQWLLGQQQVDGRWQDLPGTALRDSAAALKALAPFPVAAGALASGQAWLQQVKAANHDFLARQLAASIDRSGGTLLMAANGDGGWGGGEGFRSNPLDTALALQGLSMKPPPDFSAQPACSYLHATQQADGGWNAGAGPSQLLPTCSALLALNAQRSYFPLDNPVVAAQSWLVAAQNGDGSFGHPTGNVGDTALGLTVLKSSGGSSAAIAAAAGWLLARQSVSGSWQGSPFATALAVQALHAAQFAADLSVDRSAISFAPPMLAEVPGEVTVSVVVRNLGREPVAAVPVAVYAGDPAAGGVLRGEQLVAVSGNSATNATFVVPIEAAGVHPFFVIVDSAGLVAESDEWNNRASQALIASLPPPTIGIGNEPAVVAEGGGLLELRVTMSHPWHEPITLGYQAGAGGSAIDGVDYRPLSGTVTFPSGETSATIAVQLLDDQLAEPDKTLIIVIATPTVGTLGRSQHIVTILDDELPLLSINSPQATVIGNPTPTLLFATTAATAQVRIDGQLIDKRSGDLLGPLTEGEHVLEITAVNGLGMSSSYRVDFRIDTALPTIDVQSPIAGILNQAAPLLAFTINGASGYRLSLDGNPLYKNTGEYLDPLADGVHLLTVIAWNQAGAQVTVDVRFTIDTVPPKAAIIYPADDVLRESSPTLFCLVEDAATVVVEVDGRPVPVRCGERLGPFADGAHRVQVTAGDVVGNQTSSLADFIVFTGAESAYPTAPGWPRTAAKFYGGLAVDAAGNVYLATQDASYTLVIQKYTSQGVLVWQRRPFTATLFPQDLAVDTAGNLFVVGHGGGDGFVYKFATADGAYLARHDFVTAGSDFASAVQVDGEGQVIVAGDTGGNLYGAANGTMNVWIARLDNNCRLLAGRQLTRSGTQELAGRGGLALDRWGHAYLAGYTDAATFGASLGGDDAFVVKFDRNLWLVAPALQFGTDGDDQALDVVVDVYGNIYVGGVSKTTMYYFENGFIYKFDAAGNTLQHLSTGSQPISALNCERDGTLYAVDDLGRIGKYDSSLALLWSRDLGWNYRHQLTRDRFGDLYAAGDGGTTGSYASVIKLTDARRPAVTLDVSQLQINRAEIVLSGTLSVGATIKLVNPELQQLGEADYPQPGRWRLHVSGLQEGENHLVLQATAPNGFSRRAQASVTVDVVPPQVTIVTPGDGARCAEKPALIYTVSDGRVEVLVNGVPLYRASGELLEALRPGMNTIRLEATDPAGNLGFATVKIYAEGAAVGELPLSQAAFVQGGTSGNETTVAVASDPAGNFFMFGYTTGNFPGYVNAGYRDPFISKFAADGRHLASWQFGASEDEFGGGLTVDAGGNLYVTWNVQYVNNKGQTDSAVRLARFTSDGTLQWQAELNSSANDQVRALTLAKDGDLLLAGETYGSLDRQRYGGAGDYFVARYSATGTKRWVRLSNAVTAESIHAIAVDAAGTIYCAAYAATSLGGVAIPEHVALLRMDSSGALLKVEPVPLPGSDFTVKSLHFDPLGRLLMAGGNGSRYFLTAHDASLTRHWLQLSAADEVLSLSAAHADGAGNLLIAGEVTAGYAGHRHIGARDIVVSKHAPSGERLWSMQYGSAGNDFVGGLALGGDDEVWLGGHTDGLLGTARVGLLDYFLARLTRPPVPAGPLLNLDSTPGLINTTSLNLSGSTTPGATLALLLPPPATHSAMVVGSDGNWRVAVSHLPPDADHLLTVSASNELGTTEKTIAVTVDTRPPALTIDPPLSPTMRSSVLLTGTVEVDAELCFGGQATAQTIDVADGLWQHTVTGLLPGDNHLSFTATDDAGNTTMVAVLIQYVQPPPPTLSVTPAVISANEGTDIVLTIGQLIPVGTSVSVTQVHDLDGNGHIDGGEPLIRSIVVTDGVDTGAGHRPGDEDAMADGKISVRLNGHFVNDRFHAAGDYLFAVHTDGGYAVAGFSVLPAEHPQAITGAVQDLQGIPIGGAQVELTDRWRHSIGFARTDRLGRYRFAVSKPGDYLLWPAADGYVSDRQAPQVVQLPAGEVAVRDLLMQAGIHTLSGTVRDAVTREVIGGAAVRAVSENHQAETLANSSGNYALKLPAGNYRLALSGAYGDGLAESGYLASTAPVRELSVAADLAGVDLTSAAGTSSICGQVRTVAGSTVAGVPVTASNARSGLYAAGLSDGAGRYCVGNDGNSGWSVGIPDHLVFACGWLGVMLDSSGPADLRVFPLDARATGKVYSNAGLALAEIPVMVNHPLGPVMRGKTIIDGSYRLGLSSEPAGLWSVTVDGQGSGYLPVEPVNLPASPGAEVSRDFTLSPSTPVNSIVITRVSYDVRKKQLAVDVTSTHVNAQLQVDGYGAMTFVKLFKGKYYWSLTRSVAVKPTTVTVSGPEGSVTVVVP